jgi:hypothetical protein
MAFTVDDARVYIAGARWQFAKTMPQWPHEYTLRRQHNPATFEAAVRFIREHGYRARWGRAIRTYVNLDGKRYWTMGAPVEQTILINRADLDPVERGGESGSR